MIHRPNSSQRSIAFRGRHVRVLFVFFALFALTASGCASLRGRPSPRRTLPLVRLQLYETGVGYFERTGLLGGSSASTLPIPAGHVDDALKTLTVTAPNGEAIVSGVAFASNLSHGMARALSGLDPKGKGPVSFRALLMGLRGQAVELQLGARRLRGAPIDIKKELVPLAMTAAQDAKETSPETSAKPSAKKRVQREVLVFLDEEARILRVPLDAITSIKPLSPSLRTRLKTSLGALSSSGRQRQRLLELLSHARGKITVGYLAETPLFRVTYRLFAGDDAKRQTLQGWALVHNDTDESWHDVELSLVSGRPDSFLFPLTVPRYARRPLVHPKRALPSVPQLINTTPDEIWGDQLDEDDESYGRGALGSGEGRRGYGRGYGRIYERIGRKPVHGSHELRVGNLAAFTKAKGMKNGALFRYRLGQRLHLPAHSSAQLPFLRERLGATRMTLFAGLSAMARTATILENTTSQTLPAGTIAFFAKGSFLGESFLPRTKPGARHFLDYGRDLDVTLKADREAPPQRTTKTLRRRGRFLEEHFLQERHLTITLKNTDSAPRRVYFRLHVAKNATIKGADALDFDLPHLRAYAIFSVPAHGRQVKTLDITEGLARSFDPLDISLKKLLKLSITTALPEKTRGVLAALVVKRRALRDLRKVRGQNRSAVKQAARTLKRLRKHLAALGAKGGRAAAPLVQRILKIEDLLSAKVALMEKEKREIEAIQASVQSLVETL